jgi:thiosulfate dehydrogenase
MGWNGADFRLRFLFAEATLPFRIRVAALLAAIPFVLAPTIWTHSRPANLGTRAQTARPRVPFRIPGENLLTDSAYRASALRGRAILLATRDSLPHNVGNSLRCASCHLDGGLRRDGMPWVGAYARFPQYRPRSGKIDLIEDRINDCFERSMNGKRLNVSGRDMRDIVSYLAFLSNGVPVGSEMEGQGIPRLQPLKSNPAHGSSVFVSTCARCHGAGGQGTALAPPLWGARSYNTGAGMARINTAASFIYSQMPFDRAVKLPPQDAFDVAAYINTRPRPDFAGKKRDWPRGGKPPDADYHVITVTSKEKSR